MASFNLTVKPGQTELVAIPGSTITQAYDVVNNGQENLILSTQVLPWVQKGTDGSVDYDQALPNPHLNFSLGNADLLLGQSFTLAPGQKRQLVLKIKSDSSTPQADTYHTFFVYQNQGFSPSDTSQTVTSGRIGSHLLISYSLTENPHSQFSLSQFIVSPKIKDIFYQNLNFSAIANNNSPYYAKISGKLIISKNDQVIKQFDLFPDNVLSNGGRNISCLSDNHPIACSISPPFWPGAYKATLTLDPSLNAPSASITFFVFPYTLTFILGIILALVWQFNRARNLDK